MMVRSLRRASAGNPRAGGFTLTELLVVVALIAIIVLISAPNLQRFYMTHKVTNAARDVASLAQLARMKAVARNAPIAFAVDADARKILVYGPVPPSGPTPIEESVSVENGVTILPSGTTTITFMPNGTATFTNTCKDVQIVNRQGTTRWIKFLVSGVVRTTDKDEPLCI